MSNIKLFSQEDRSFFYYFLKSGFKFSLLVILLTVNFTALAVALQCNREAGFGTKLVSGLYAFFFGIIYLIVNYYSYRVLHLKKPCQFDGSNVFPF